MELAHSSSAPQSSLPLSDFPIVVPALNLVSITQRELTQLKLAANYWKALHQRSCTREAILKNTIEQNKAEASEREILLKNVIELKEAQIRDLSTVSSPRRVSRSTKPSSSNLR